MLTGEYVSAHKDAKEHDVEPVSDSRCLALESADGASRIGIVFIKRLGKHLYERDVLATLARPLHRECVALLDLFTATYKILERLPL